VNRTELVEALNELFDRQLLFHGYTDYMRDYELFVYETVDPRSGRVPRHCRFLFQICPEVEVRSRVSPETWAHSLGDDLVAASHVSVDATGYIWGVRGQEMYPGASLVQDSERARTWTEQVGVSFFEARIEANAHVISLVFSDLKVEDIAAGYCPYCVSEDGVAERYAEGSTIPLPPSAQ
jgi:hypothetical protein